MTNNNALLPAKRGGSSLWLWLGSLALTVAIILDTKVVVIGSEDDTRQQAFSVDGYALKTFPEIQSSIVSRAVDANELANAITENKKKAAEKYGVKSKGGIGSVIPVSFQGLVEKGKSGILSVNIEGIPEKIRVRVQTGPAINGTDLRDATGTIGFNQFKNQIEYQDVGAALNNEMKRQVLSSIDNKNLEGKRIAVTGVFKLINAKNWLVTPVKFEVQP
ncbi:hypothetical protein VINI7043_08875 [Vibrio nigripulchritudo ATCC 27043]|uniref:DUF2291 family protein n=1 Tax=Vibrio nigripulchritudo TaxID=28173 RepID=UPI00021C2E34|nr:DUF2291 domain-containing protein [Vibrio nigripulchritudo]EGU55203.1 hypothetical protein VINI7043_08875 [Vibrio nigripulchritudo ATCC 27043]